MSAGSSSQLAACFSVERTKYLMLPKSMPVDIEVLEALAQIASREVALQTALHDGAE
jgi:hypothetical protein